ncbi:hypothetical protein B296_00029826 [Ensete ventricosum]|uniref:Uncharacterized protein n=1 Tax=Ensete ventricosum TaxID=4639 RepID=A0A427A4G7_ENSVE|nr:hypothetical protein B296_00029826 [Ensete ventricosum]
MVTRVGRRNVCNFDLYTWYGRYVLVRQVTGTWIARYWAVLPKSTVGDRFWPLAVDFGRRRSIEGEIDRRRLIEGEEGKKKKKWKIRKKKRRRRKKYLLSPRHPRPCVVAARGRFFSCARRRNVSLRRRKIEATTSFFLIY